MRSVLLPRSLGLTLKEATAIAAALGHRDIRFVALRSSGRGPRIAPARRRDDRSARFIRDERRPAAPA